VRPVNRFINIGTEEEKHGSTQKVEFRLLPGEPVNPGLVGWLTESWLVLMIGLAVLVGMNVNNGDIRLDKRKGR
jgi:hypothetical protein